MRIKKNDQVIVISGKDKGKTGRVLKVFPDQNRVLVEKANYQTVYLRRSQQNPKGGITKSEGKMHISNVKLVCPKTNKPTRVGYMFLKDGTKHRMSKKSQEIV